MACIQSEGGCARRSPQRLVLAEALSAIASFNPSSFVLKVLLIVQTSCGVHYQSSIVDGCSGRSNILQLLVLCAVNVQNYTNTQQVQKYKLKLCFHRCAPLIFTTQAYYTCTPRPSAVLLSNHSGDEATHCSCRLTRLLLQWLVILKLLSCIPSPWIWRPFSRGLGTGRSWRRDCSTLSHKEINGVRISTQGLISPSSPVHNRTGRGCSAEVAGKATAAAPNIQFIMLLMTAAYAYACYLPCRLMRYWLEMPLPA
jgi:hypothetical protein